MVLMGRWWNGLWGRMARRDIWLYRETVWHVHAREGDAETGRTLHWRFDHEETARTGVHRLMATSQTKPGAWRDLTGLLTTAAAPTPPVDDPESAAGGTAPADHRAGPRAGNTGSELPSG